MVISEKLYHLIWGYTPNNVLFWMVTLNGVYYATKMLSNPVLTKKKEHI